MQGCQKQWKKDRLIPNLTGFKSLFVRRVNHLVKTWDKSLKNFRKTWGKLGENQEDLVANQKNLRKTNVYF